MLPVMWVREAAMLNLGDDAVINAAAPEHNPRISEKISRTVMSGIFYCVFVENKLGKN